MRSRKEEKGRTLDDRDLKGVQGGTDASTPPVDNGGGQSSDARAQVIETG
jgi:hypothetical protein